MTQNFSGGAILSHPPPTAEVWISMNEYMDSRKLCDVSHNIELNSRKRIKVEK